MGYHLLSADPFMYVDDIWAYPMGFLAIAEMGRSLGEVAYTLSHRPFLRSLPILRGVLRPVAF